MNSQIKIAILGGGRIGYIHAKTIQLDINNAHVCIVYDPYLNDDIKHKFKQLNISNFTNNINQILNDQTIDVVYICTPTNTHAQLAIKCLNAKKHVFCEKPVSLNVNEILAVKKAIELNLKKFSVGHNRRFDHNFLAIKNAIENKKIGNPIQIIITSYDPGLPSLEYLKSSGGLFYDMMIHDLDMALFLMQKKVKTIYATGACLCENQLAKQANDYDSAVVNLEFEDNTTVTIINCRYASYGYDQRVEVLGTNGGLQILNDTNDTLIVKNEKGIIHQKPLAFFLERYMNSYQLETKLFLNAIKNNTKESVSINDGLNAVLLAAAATKAAKLKTLIDFNKFIKNYEYN